MRHQVFAIQAIVVPIDPDSSRLNAKRWTGGKARLSQSQDRYAEAMEDLGLERGIKGSVAKHTDVKAWYSQMQAPMPVVPVPEIATPPAILLTGRETWAEAQSERIAEAQAPAIARLEVQARAYHEESKKREEYEATARRQAEQIADLERRGATQDGEMASLRQHADLVRHGVPLGKAVSWFEPEELAEGGLSIGTDGEGRSRIFQGGKVVGRNAIDLVQLATGLKGRDAIAWIYERTDHQNAIAATVNHAYDEAIGEAAVAAKQAEEPSARTISFERFVRAAGRRAVPTTLAMMKRHQFEIRDVNPNWQLPAWTMGKVRKWGYDARLKRPLALSESLVDTFLSFMSSVETLERAQREEARLRMTENRYRGPRR